MNRQKISGIYSITCTVPPPARFAGWEYFGQSNDVDKRVNSHTTELNLGRHGNHLLQEAWLLYGPERFEFRVLSVVLPARSMEEKRVVLTKIEQQYIDEHFGQNCFNLCPDAATRLGTKRSPDVVEKTASKWRGRKHTDETKAKMSAAHKGIAPAPHVLAAAAAAHARGWKWTPEALARRVASQTGMKRRPETGQKISHALKGRPRAPEHVAAFRAQRATPEYSAKLAAAWVGRRQRAAARMLGSALGEPPST